MPKGKHPLSNRRKVLAAYGRFLDEQDRPLFHLQLAEWAAEDEENEQVTFDDDWLFEEEKANSND